MIDWLTNWSIELQLQVKLVSEVDEGKWSIATIVCRLTYDLAWRRDDVDPRNDRRCRRRRRRLVALTVEEDGVVQIPAESIISQTLRRRISPELSAAATPAATAAATAAANRWVSRSNYSWDNYGSGSFTYD